MKKIKLLVSSYLLLTVLFTSYAINIIDVKKNNLSGNDFLENSNGPQCRGVNDESIFNNLPIGFTFKCEMPYALYYFDGNFTSYSEWAKLISDKYPTSYSYKKIEYNASDLKENNNDCLILNYNLKLKSNDKNTKGEVTKLQNFLISNDYLIGVNANGNYGPSTLKAVKNFEKSNNLIITGVVSKITREKINKSSCNQIQPTSLVPTENTKVNKHKTIEEFLDTREKQSKYINMYIQVNENDFCGLEEKLPIRVYVILNNKSFEKKCFSKTFLFANGSTYDGTGTVFMYEGKIMLWEEFLKNLEREILISNEIPVFKIEKI